MENQINIKKIIIIQKIVRGFLVRQRLRKCNENAIKIQSLYRGYVTRKSFRIYKDLYSKKKIIENSLIKHEKFLKNKLEELQKLRQLSNNKYFEYKKESRNNAAIIIQKTWRGHYTRKNINKIKQMQSLLSLYEDKDNNNMIDLSFIEKNNSQNLINDKIWLKKKFEIIDNSMHKYRRECKKNKCFNENNTEEVKKALTERLKNAQNIMDIYYENYFHFFQLKKEIYENKNALDILSLNLNCKKINDLKLLPVVKQNLSSMEIKKVHQKLINDVKMPWWKVLKNNYDLNHIDFDYINEIFQNRVK
ncbi:hypothetical protein BCR36DRAFT_358557 [Piromyces finnis]|uniref:Myosin motor domain-containing protein n=1 Tax=Piromyces finnis TaxID=1754191 RepID=A0A1Y1V1H2_9FUNG|nr:hypothetical protein BCR36DRAFT_358557 [Piromyces finnis]|eukprot:ORX45153.1 hypothetical protein BCR36DRAFT_358557 [Piromyces finnis]